MKRSLLFFMQRNLLGLATFVAGDFCASDSTRRARR